MKLIVIKVAPDVVNGGVLALTVGVFEEGKSQPTIQMNVSKSNISKDTKEIVVGQEVLLTSK